MVCIYHRSWYTSIRMVNAYTFIKIKLTSPFLEVWALFSSFFCAAQALSSDPFPVIIFKLYTLTTYEVLGFALEEY